MSASKRSPVILAIESSCDETAAAIAAGGAVLSNIIATQSIHQKYGGVVPELASRAHLQHITAVVAEALAVAELTLAEVDAFAFTQAPGLIGSLMVGASFTKSLALTFNKPLIAVHHMQAHVLANLASDPAPSFPFLCLTVSGGHTQIVRCEAPDDMEVLGETLDDAAGEAFDKSAKLLGLPYPGGPLIDKYSASGNARRFKFPEPKIPGLDFSFSGLKTAILYFIQRETALNPNFVAENLPDICASIQDRIISILLNKYQVAAKESGISNLCIAGGVSANKGLRKAFAAMAEKHGWKAFIPPFEYCTDNAGMIAITAHYKFLSGQFSELDVSPSARSEW